MFTETDTPEHEKERNFEYAIVMIKPHAMRQVLDPVIVDIFGGDLEKYLNTSHINIAPEELHFLRAVLGETKLVGQYYRDLNDPRYHPVLDVFYAKESGQPYYNTILDEYTGPCVFLLLSSTAQIDDLHLALKIIRGYQELLNSDDSILKRGSGIRGILTYPGTFVTAENVTAEQTRRIVRNVIHIPDDAHETASALRFILPKTETDNSLQRFLNKYAPTSLV